MISVMGRHASSLVHLGLVFLGWLAGHTLSYRLVAPTEDDHAALLRASGHSYLAVTPLAVSLLATLVVAGVVLRTLARSSPLRPGRRAWLYGFVAPLGFAFQEHIERLAHPGALPLEASLEPTFLLGIGLQIPFALAAVAVARVLIGVADTIRGACAARRTSRRLAATSPRRPLRSPSRPRSPLAERRAGRAPPLPLPA